MKTHIKNLSPLPALIAGLGLMVAGPVTAQVFTTLHSFTGASDGAGGDVSLLSGNTLYGVSGGGSSGSGTVFAVNTDGTGFTTLYSFYPTNSDGFNPDAGLILSGNTLYGTAQDGGTSGNGTVFKVNIDGSGFTTLHSFTALSGPYPATNSDGASPAAGLILWGKTLYGTARVGGSSGSGTVFALNTDGTGFTNLHDFSAINRDAGTNSDGADLYAGMILSGDTLYGTAYQGGSFGMGGIGEGVVFKVNTDGTGFTTLHNFTGGSDGARPVAGMILSGNTLYGTASQGGTSGGGTVFKVNIDGSGFTTLHSFTALSGPYPATNSDGASPAGGLILWGKTLYGTASVGGSSGSGTVFAVNTDGTGFTTLYSFTGNIDGAGPYSLILSGNTLYGTASGGGISGNGTVFSLSFPPQPTIIPSGPYVILTWPSDYAGYILQSTTNLGSSAVWATNSPAPVVIGGQNVVINTISGRQQFFRLSQ